MTRPTPATSPRRAPSTTGLWVVAIAVLLLGLVLLLLALGRQPAPRPTAEVLPAPTVALPTVPAGFGAPPPYQVPPQGNLPSLPPAGGAASLPAALPGGMPGTLSPGAPAAMAVGPPPTPRPTPTPPVAATIQCREGVAFEVEPEEAVVTINGEVIGRARLFGEDDAFEFPGPGRYYLRISSPGYEDYWLRVDVHPEAEKKTRTIKVKLSKRKD